MTEPITSENCHLLTPLDLFYWSLEQIVIQGQRSLDGDLRCSYRTRDDLTGNILKCAAGHCIPDDAYDPVMEHIALDTPGELAGAALGHSRLNAYFNGRFSVDQLKAIKCAQIVHDHGSLPAIHTLAASTGVITFEVLQEALAVYRPHYPDDAAIILLLDAVEYTSGVAAYEYFLKD